MNLKTLLGLISSTDNSLAAKNAGNIRRIKITVILIRKQICDGGGEDRTRLKRIMSAPHSPDCYTPVFSNNITTVYLYNT